MPELNKIPRKELMIRFADCDPLGHLNNTRYLDYFLNAREDHLMESYGLSVYQVGKETGFTWVSANYKMAFLKEAMAQESVSISSRLIDYNESRIRVEMQMNSKDLSICKAVLWAEFWYFDLKTRSAAKHHEKWMGLFEQLLFPIEEEGFDLRLRVLARANKAI